ncbi:MAG: 2-polyprenyl-3-methyl-6-methoxy-1,4-benzoquinone monooxygenase [Wenzhouxiangellaceae bacterium]|nr:2-polyprenyl-3-methyl-6-methoxy-1,4-benzoquinone monooxygenase [Wenzhouxiangellaceae bacterium]
MNLVDRLFTQIDQALRVTLAPAPPGHRPSPAADKPDCELDAEQRADVAGLMRVNHTGEVCAQALYAGQAVTARTPEVQAEMQHAADEEVDHLSWCATRLDELGSRPSLLNPFWYAGSFTIGALAGVAGDRWSLGFVEATERQVEAHLEGHLSRLPEQDRKSRAIVEQMKIDEAKHAEMAMESGAARLPPPVQGLMALTAGVMKFVAYRI